MFDKMEMPDGLDAVLAKSRASFPERMEAIARALGALCADQHRKWGYKKRVLKQVGTWMDLLLWVKLAGRVASKGDEGTQTFELPVLREEVVAPLADAVLAAASEAVDPIHALLDAINREIKQCECSPDEIRRAARSLEASVERWCDKYLHHALPDSREE